MASMSSASVRPFCLARARWYVSCSVFPPVVRAATVSRLRSLGESSVRGQTWPNRTSSVRRTNSGANSPNCFWAPEGSGVSFIGVLLLSWAWGVQSARFEPQGGGRGGTGGHGLDVTGVEARVLGAIPAVEVLVRWVRGPGESHVPFGAGAADAAGARAERVPVPAAAGASPRPDVQAVVDTDDPDRGEG